MNTVPSSNQPANHQIAFIQAGWHSEIVRQSHAGFVDRFVAKGGTASHVSAFDVPGAFEIPLKAKLLAQSGEYSAIVCAALVVDGGIYRHDFVASAVVSGLMQVQLETRIPVLSVVLTPHHFHEHAHHQKAFFEHFRVKGAEAANAVYQLLSH